MFRTQTECILFQPQPKSGGEKTASHSTARRQVPKDFLGREGACHRHRLEGSHRFNVDEEFKAALTLFAGHVEQKKARGILVDGSRFRH
jgi:hypothetical protein